MERWSDDGAVIPIDDLIVGTWCVDDEAKDLLREVGLPTWGSLFIRCPQGPEQPILPPYYIFGRESVGKHPHEVPPNTFCGCGYFGISAEDGSVWQLFPGRAMLPVNSSLALFYEFLNKVCGAWPGQNGDLPERVAVRKAEAVMHRLVPKDPILTSGVDSFWGYVFARPWG